MRVLAILLLLVALFCAYGFLAAHEPGISPAWRWGYAGAGGLCVALALTLFLLRRPERR
ncbi:MAG: hypothetical protein KDA22_07090 [Phycisphaerales bacterium]|nr:hypothetical protein [Phycisphaerales bacterium]